MRHFLIRKSFSDFLNSAEYIIQIQEYDRKKLKEYQETVAYIRRRGTAVRRRLCHVRGNEKRSGAGESLCGAGKGLQLQRL